jgi:hypothetical protein
MKQLPVNWELFLFYGFIYSPLIFLFLATTQRRCVVARNYYYIIYTIADIFYFRKIIFTLDFERSTFRKTRCNFYGNRIDSSPCVYSAKNKNTFMQNDNPEKESPTPEEQKAIWLEEIKSNAAVTEYLNQFQPKSVEEFIK